MLGSIVKPKPNKNCILCNKKINTPYYYVLSDESYIQQECLNLVQNSILDKNTDQEMKHFYSFILEKVVDCTTCSRPLDILHSDYMVLPYCSKCKPPNLSIQKQTQVCELCDQIITPRNKIRKPSVIEGIVMCRSCYGQQTGQIEEKPQQKPDFRDYRPSYYGVQNKPFQFNNNIFQSKFSMANGFVKNPFLQKKQEKPQKVFSFDKASYCTNCKVKLASYNNQYPYMGMCGPCATNPFKVGQKWKPHSIPIKPPVPPAIFQQCQPQKQESYHLEQLFHQEEAEAFKIFQLLAECQKQPKAQISKQEDDQKTITVQVQVMQAHKYCLKECKICLNAQSQMMTRQCRHMMMCEGCYKMLLTRQNKKNELCCPVCQTVGKYFKYLEPIYI